MKKRKDDELELYKDVTIAGMNVEGMPGYREEPEEDGGGTMHDMGISRGERRAMIKGAFQAMAPAFFIGLGVFCVAFLILRLILLLLMH